MLKRFFLIVENICSSYVIKGQNMKNATFNPQIITKYAETIIQLSRLFGFKEHRNPEGIGKLNVYDFDATYEFFAERGFKKSHGDNKVVTKSGRSAIMIALLRFVINFVQHIKA